MHINTYTHTQHTYSTPPPPHTHYGLYYIAPVCTTPFLTCPCCNVNVIQTCGCPSFVPRRNYSRCPADKPLRCCWLPSRLCAELLCYGVRYVTGQYSVVQYSTLQYTTLHHTALHYTTLHHTALPYTTLHYTALHYTALHYCTILHYTTPHYTTLQSSLSL